MQSCSQTKNNGKNTATKRTMFRWAEVDRSDLSIPVCIHQPYWTHTIDMCHVLCWTTAWQRQTVQELTYRKQLARQLRTRYAEGICDNTVTLKFRLTVTQGHWKRNYWEDHTRLTIRRVIGRWILSRPWNVGQRSLKVIEISAIWKLVCGFLFAFYSNYGRICSRLRYSMLKNGVTLKTRLGVVQGHWKWRRSIDHFGPGTGT